METNAIQPRAKPTLAVGLIPSDNGLLTIDALLIGAEVWLVPEWVQTQDGKWQWPVRAIRVDVLGVQRDPWAGWDFLLAQSVPTAVLEGRVPPSATVPVEVLDHVEPLTWCVPTRANH